MLWSITTPIFPGKSWQNSDTQTGHPRLRQFETYMLKGSSPVSYWDIIAENQIKDAIQKGDFENLKNAGRPLASNNDEMAGENWIANHILEQNDELPDWLSLRLDITRQREVAKKFRDEAIERLNELPNRLWPTDARLRRLIELYGKNVKKLNLLIDEHNHRCPSIQHELVRMREDAIDRKREIIRRERGLAFTRDSTVEPDR